MRSHAGSVTLMLAVSVGGVGVALVGYAIAHQAMGSGASASSTTSGGNTPSTSPSCSAPAGLPGARVDVTASDMGMTQMMGGAGGQGARMQLRATPTSVPAGQVSIVVRNVGRLTHELVVLPLADGRAAGSLPVGSDGRVSEAGSLGEASASCAAGTGEGIASGAVGWTQLDLQPGRYEVVCNLANHYADGMWQELDVRA